MISFDKERCEIIAEYIIKTGCTVRAAAEKFGVSKSTVHKDITENLKKINPALFSDVEPVLQNNKAQRHIRGGEATKRKYCLLKESKLAFARLNADTDPT